MWLRWIVCNQFDRFLQLYREPKTSADMPAILEAYAADTKKASGSETSLVCHAAHCNCGQGNKALLSCVVGAKLSEGINFSDELARCGLPVLRSFPFLFILGAALPSRLVVVVGLPFGNVKDVELRARMQYLDSLAGVASKAAGPYPPITGREYYTDLCMKAVNQSIGRSIRHAGDFACIVLVDERYDGADAQARLPAWVRGAGKQLSYPTFGAAYQAAAGGHCLLSFLFCCANVIRFCVRFPGFFKRNAAPAAAAP